MRFHRAVSTAGAELPFEVPFADFQGPQFRSETRNPPLCNHLNLSQGRWRQTPDPAFQSVAEAALRALREPACVPLDLPSEHYEMWRSVVITFEPLEAL